MEKLKQEKKTFLIRQLVKGSLFLVLLISLFFIFEEVFPESEREALFGAIYDNIALVLGVFVLSEVFFGIIPPEVFMLWVLRTGHLGEYFVGVGVLSAISYLAGALNYHLGRWMRNARFFTKIRDTWFKKSFAQFERFGSYLIIVAAVTPLPFAAIALLSGAGNIQPKTYYLNSIWRIIRFFIYAYILHETAP